MPELWSDRPVNIQTPNTLEQLICAAEIAKAALTKLASVSRSDAEWLKDYERAENAWAIAETELSCALTQRGFDVARIVGVLS